MRSSGTFSYAADELYTKATRAYFSISNVVYTHKKWPIDKALTLFDTIVSPVALYACELWSPLTIGSKYFKNSDSLFRAWEDFKPELLNQKVCRLLLGVNKKATRLAVLGELGRFPLILRALSHTLKYEWQIANKPQKSSLVSQAFLEMQSMQKVKDGWYNRVAQIKSLFKIPNLPGSWSPSTVGTKINKLIHDKFSMFWKDELKSTKIGEDIVDHSKLRFYRTLKGSFTAEPYVSLINNRNQRNWLTRIRISAHNLKIERGRYTQPTTPILERLCNFCNSSCIDDEQHFMLFCSTFEIKRRCLFGQISSFNPRFLALSDSEKLSTILCPSDVRTAKLVNKFISIMTEARTRIEKGGPIDLGAFNETQNDHSDEEETLS